MSSSLRLSVSSALCEVVSGLLAAQSRIRRVIFAKIDVPATSTFAPFSIDIFAVSA